MRGMIWGFTCLCARSDPAMSVVAAEVVKKIKGFKHQEPVEPMFAVWPIARGWYHASDGCWALVDFFWLVFFSLH